MQEMNGVEVGMDCSHKVQEMQEMLLEKFLVLKNLLFLLLFVAKDILPLSVLCCFTKRGQTTWRIWGLFVMSHAGSDYEFTIINAKYDTVLLVNAYRPPA